MSVVIAVVIHIDIHIVIYIVIYIVVSTVNYYIGLFLSTSLSYNHISITSINFIQLFMRDTLSTLISKKLSY